MDMHYQELLTKIHEIYDLRKAARVLTWDREIVMPKGGDSDRINQLATIHRICHALYTSDEMGELIELAAAELNGANYLSVEASLIRFLRRDFYIARRLPVEFVSRSTTINNQATAAWKKAREEDDFGYFLPWLEKSVELSIEKAELLGFEHNPYDALLDRYEPEVTTVDVQRLFDRAKVELISLLQAIYESGITVNDDFLRQPFDLQKQYQAARYLASTVGYDFDRGHLATSVHPFSTSLSRNDVRITTRYIPDYLSPALFASLHESGHAIYIQNIHPELERTLLAKETSAGIDESQSRLVENFVGRSRGFWLKQLPFLHKAFPAQLGNVNLNDFYRAINKVQPSFIRVESDELTYNLHIILRFELEQELINGNLAVSQIPQAWNQKMEEYIGIVPSTYRDGCLQDIHWTMVGFGYFPTYTLGNFYAAQFLEAAQDQVVEIREQLSQGDLTGMTIWLRENIHQYGRKLRPAEIVFRATGRSLNEEAFVRYTYTKFGELYNLN